jgi:hypothetical protein
MELIEIRHIEDCFDGSYIKLFVFEGVITERMVLTLGKDKKMNLYKDFPRPFYQIIDKSFQIKGILGNNYFQIILFSKDKQIEDELINNLKNIE